MTHNDLTSREVNLAGLVYPRAGNEINLVRRMAEFILCRFEAWFGFCQKDLLRVFFRGASWTIFKPVTTKHTKYTKKTRAV